MKYLLAVLILFIPHFSFAESAREIVEKSDQQMRGNSSYVEMTMDIIRPDWTRSMGMKAWGMGVDYSMVLVTAPAKDKGSSSLKRGTEMWNWVPRVERVIKIAPSMLGQSWMGSDFTNDDLINQSSIVVDYKHEMVSQALVDGVETWVIDAIAKKDAPVVWSKIRLWISKASYNQRKIEFYDEFGELINTLSTWDVQALGQRMIPTRLIMAPADKAGHKTVITYQAAEFDFDIDTSFFSLANMKELR